jgi:hypothetical protein
VAMILQMSTTQHVHNCQIVGMKKKKQQQQLDTAATGKKAYDVQTNLILQAGMHGGLVVLVQHYNQAYTNVHSFKCRKLDFWLDCRTCFSACGGFRSCCCL